MTLLGGYSYEDNYYQNSGAQNRQFVTDFFGYNNLQAGENLRPSDVWSGKNMTRLISFFGRATYNYKMRYLFEASVRRDGSSKFGANHKWATFPSFSAAWRMNEESFLADVKALDELKLRVGYGTSGNQEGIDPYQSLQLYGASGQYYDNGKWYRAYQISQNGFNSVKNFHTFFNNPSYQPLQKNEEELIIDLLLNDNNLIYLTFLQDNGKENFKQLLKSQYCIILIK